MGERDVRAGAAFMVAWGNTMLQNREEREAFFDNLASLLHQQSAEYVHGLAGKRAKERDA